MARAGSSVAAARRKAPESAKEGSGHPATWAGLGTFVAAWLGLPWMVPVVAVVPLAWARMRRHDDWLAGEDMWLRWLAGVLLGTVCAIGLVGGPALRSVPLAPRAVAAATAWLGGANAAPPLIWMAVGTLLFVGSVLATRGFLGWFVLAFFTAQAAVSAHVVYLRAGNLFAATPIAIPPWTLAWIVGMAEVLGTSSGGLKSPFRRGAAPRWWLGPALIVLALILRVSLAGLFTALAAHATIS